MTKQQKTQQVITLMNLIDEYAEVRHINGCWVYNGKTASARQAVIEALSGVQALSAAPVKACVCGEPRAPGTVHRVDGPCYVAEPQQEAQKPIALLVRKNSWRAGQWEAAPPDSPHYGLTWANQRKYVYEAPQPACLRLVTKKVIEREVALEAAKEQHQKDTGHVNKGGQNGTK